MKTTFITSIVLSIVILLFGFASEPSSNQIPGSRNLLQQMLQSIDNVKTLKYSFKAKERIEGKPFVTELDVKYNESPLRLYVYTKSEPNKGVEILYREGEWENKALVNPGKWLPNIKFSPYHPRLRKNQHNTILQSGFGMLRSIISDAMNRADRDAPEQFEEVFKIKGEITFQGKACYELEITDPEFAFVSYTVKDGEDINKIAYGRGISGYLIVQNNASLDDFDDLEPGMTVKIPTSYAKKTILYIDKENNLPIVQIMFDEIGEFERYEFLNLKVNPSIKEIEFTKDFEGYKF